MRRVNVAIYFICKGTRDHAFKSIRTIAEHLADEVINTSKNNAQSSWAIRKKDEIEKVAKGNR
jgi:small subunit ribosomal protein S5e